MKPMNPSEWIDNYLVRQPAEPREDFVYWPSEILLCLRQTFFKIKQPRPWKRETLRTLESGRIFHEFISDVLANTPEVRLVAKEEPFELVFPEGFSIRGRFDDILWILKDNELLAVEVKTLHPYTFDSLTSPKWEHAGQLMIYLRAARCKRGLLWYIDRASLRDRWFEITYDPNIFEKILNRFRTLHGCVKSGEMPLPEGKLVPEMGWQCSGCLYQDLCR